MYFFFLFTQQQKERKSTKKKEKPKQYSNILTSIHSFGCVSCSATPNLFSLANSGTALRQCSAKKLILIFYPPSSALQAPSPVKGEGWYLNTAERQAKRLARQRVRACPPKQKRLSRSGYSCEDVGNICVFSFFSFAVSFGVNIFIL